MNWLLLNETHGACFPARSPLEEKTLEAELHAEGTEAPLEHLEFLEDNRIIVVCEIL